MLTEAPSGKTRPPSGITTPFWTRPRMVMRSLSFGWHRDASTIDRLQNARGPEHLAPARRISDHYSLTTDHFYFFSTFGMSASASGTSA
jgi:hypothetical protein